MLYWGIIYFCKCRHARFWTFAASTYRVCNRRYLSGCISNIHDIKYKFSRFVWKLDFIICWYFSDLMSWEHALRYDVFDIFVSKLRKIGINKTHGKIIWSFYKFWLLVMLFLHSWNFCFAVMHNLSTATHMLNINICDVKQKKGWSFIVKRFNFKIIEFILIKPQVFGLHKISRTSFYYTAAFIKKINFAQWASSILNSTAVNKIKF